MPAPTPLPSSPAPSPTPTATAAALPSVEAALAALDSAPGDDRAPGIRLGVALSAGESQFLEDLRATPVGAGAVRVACANEDGSNVTVEVTIGDAEPFDFAAPCAPSAGSGTAMFTTQEHTFGFASPYRFTVLSSTAATVAVGVVPNPPQ